VPIFFQDLQENTCLLQIHHQ